MMKKKNTNVNPICGAKDRHQKTKIIIEKNFLVSNVCKQCLFLSDAYKIYLGRPFTY